MGGREGGLMGIDVIEKKTYRHSGFFRHQEHPSNTDTHGIKI